MAGIPLFEATVTLTFPDKSVRPVCVLWNPMGRLMVCGGLEANSEWVSHLGTFGDDAEVAAQVSLDEDPTVVSDVVWDDEEGFVPQGNALADYVRKTFPDDCAYLDKAFMRIDEAPQS